MEGVIENVTSEFVAVNTIECDPEYVPRFRALFQSRAHAIDRLPGFRGMYVLEPQESGGAYLVVSQWESEACFRAWTESAEFMEGHRRAFADIKEATARGEAPPMRSQFATYRVLAR
jgi:heme-degrading monooxygenase HmoA